MTPNAERTDPYFIILAGGISSRMKKGAEAAKGVDPSLSHEAQVKPKGMIGVGENRRPFLDYLLRNIETAGYRQVAIVVGEGDDSIRQYYESGDGSGRFPSLTLSYAVQTIPPGRDKPLGTADALLTALRAMPAWRGRRFTVCNSDNLYSVKALQLLLKDPHDNVMIDYDRSALKFDHERITHFGIIRKDVDGYLQQIIEKPSQDEIRRAADASGRLGVSMNIFQLSYDQIYPVLEVIPLHPSRQEKELPIAVNMLVERIPRSMYTIPLSEHVVDLTMPADIPVVTEYLRNEGDQNARSN